MPRAHADKSIFQKYKAENDKAEFAKYVAAVKIQSVVRKHRVSQIKMAAQRVSPTYLHVL